MPIAVSFSIIPSEALRLGMPYFDVFLSGWGGGVDIAATSDGSGLIYPFAGADIRLPAPRGIMIHPESDFDRVLVETSVGTAVNDAVSHATPLNRQSFTVSVDAPLILAPPAIPVPAGTPQVVPASTVVLRAHPDAIFHAQYAKSGTAALTSFTGATVPLADPVRTAFSTPRLGLRFFLQTPPSVLMRAAQTFPRRADNLGGGTAQWDPVAVNATTAPGEQLFAIIPIHGRSCVTPIFRAIDCTPTIRVAVNDFGSGDIAPSAAPTEGGSQVQMERTLVTTTALVSNVPVQSSYSPMSDWLMLYYTPGDANVGLLMWQVRTSP
jgi:hypothetical protein